MLARFDRMAFVLAGVLAFAGSSAASADVHEQVAKAEWSGTISKARLAHLDRVLEEYVADGRIPGAVMLVLQHGEPVYERAVGFADKEAKRPMRTDTIFRIASQTKAITSVAVLQLVEEGKLTLNTPLSSIIPEFGQAQVAVAKDGATEFVPLRRPITIRDLLSHTSGYSYGLEPQVASLYAAKGLGPAAGFGWYTIDKDEPICTTMARLGTLPAVAQPGEAWVYGYNTDILGCVVERVSGKPFDVYLRERILDPLDMRDTHFFLPKSQRDRLATVYASGEDGKAVRAPEGAKGQGHYVDGPRKNFSGGAGLLSTARDYARFLEMIRNGGTLDGKRILGPRAVALMRTNQVGELHSSNGAGFGLGFQTVERYGANGMEAPGGFGWGGAYGSLYRIDPAAGLTIVFMVQLIPNRTDIREKVTELVYQALD
jgi:Beta-lactamase class C and other penicillin binding proteins